MVEGLIERRKRVRGEVRARREGKVLASLNGANNTGPRQYPATKSDIVKTATSSDR